MKFFPFLLPFWVIFAFLDPDRDPQTHLIRIRNASRILLGLNPVRLQKLCMVLNVRAAQHWAAFNY